MTITFYRQVDHNRFIATEHSRGPWNASAQHAGPPSALAGRAAELRADSRPGLRVARVTVEIRRPIPIGALTAATTVVREEDDVDLVDVALRTDDGVEVLSARVLRIRVADALVPPVAGLEPQPGPESAEPKPFFPVAYDVGYHAAMDWRFVSGAFQEPGPAICWLRMRGTLVEDETPSPLVRTLVAADCGNGISGTFDWRTHTFINPDMTVHLHRYPVGDWVCLDAVTSVDQAGIGLADTALHDEQGVIGRAAQSLLVAPRR